MGEFITGDVWDKVNNYFTVKQGRKKACIAYVTSQKLELEKDDVLICDASDYAIKNGSTSAKTLKYYFDNGVKIYTNQNLHAKFLLTTDFLILGSSNLSKNSAESLIESAIRTEDRTLMAQSESFIYQLIEDKDCTLLLDASSIDEKLAIKVERKAPRVFTKSKVRDITFGEKMWILDSIDMSVEENKKYEKAIEKDISEIKKDNGFIDEVINTYKIHGNSTFAAQVKSGDQIIVKWGKNKRKYIYKPNTILKVNKVENLIHYKIAEKVSWSKFKSSLKDKKLLAFIDGSKCRKISKNDFEKFKEVWSRIDK